jgi:hypothetical protein
MTMATNMMEEYRLLAVSRVPLMPTSSQEAEIHLGYGDGDSDKRRHLGSTHLRKPSEKPGLVRIHGHVRQHDSEASPRALGYDEEAAVSFNCDENSLSYDRKMSKKRRKIENLDMDGEIWGNLPDELVDTVIEHLPITSVIRAQLVCKRWRSVIASPLCYHESDTPWLMLQNKDGDGRWFFDLALNRWHRIEAKPFQRTVCVAASGGILCLHKEDGRFAKLYLFNPINRDLIRLPVLSGHVKLAALAVNPNSMDYRVLVLVLGRNGLLLRMHQSNTSRWTNSDFHTSSKLLKGVIDAVFFDDRLYCITHKNWAILKVFDVRESVWKDLAVKRPRIFHVNLKKTPRLYLVQSQGELMMVLRIIGPWWEGPEDEESGTEGPEEPLDMHPLVRKRVWIFKFDSARMSWTEVSEIQGRIFFLSRLGSRSVQATGRGNLIYFTESDRRSSVVLYDVENQSWEEFPPCPASPDPSSCLYVPYPGEGLWFEPQMSYQFR